MRPPDLPSLTLLLGGARSGKSHLAETLAARHGGRVTYLATSPRIDGDDDLDERIERHRTQRPASWHTVESEVDLAATLRDDDAGLVLVDCLTLWVNNMVWRDHSPEAIMDTARHDARLAADRTDPTIVVSNEVGLGVHPDTELGRDYRDLLGRVNQVWARAADRTLFLVAGRALELHDPVTLLFERDAPPRSGNGPNRSEADPWT